jgi:UDP-glucose 4-epimerase
VLVDDVAEIVRLSLVHRSTGVLNVASGQITSFRGVAEQVVALFETPVQIAGTPRSGPMPHNGLRPFDVSATGRAFPEFRYAPLSQGLAQVHAETK